MGALEHLTIAVPVELADRLRGRVAAGEFTNMDEAVQVALTEFELEVSGREADFDDWVRRVVAPAVEANRRDPSRLLTGEQVLRNLAVRRAARAAAAAA